MVEIYFRWFERVERLLLNYVVRIIDQMETSQINKDSGKLTQTIR